jgi:hypothetical protein
MPYLLQNSVCGSAALKPVAKLTAEEPVTDDRAGHQHECFMGEGVLFLPSLQFAKLVQPGQAAFDEPASLAQATAVGRAPFGQERLYPLFLSSFR